MNRINNFEDEEFRGPSVFPAHSHDSKTTVNSEYGLNMKNNSPVMWVSPRSPDVLSVKSKNSMSEPLVFQKESHIRSLVEFQQGEKRKKPLEEVELLPLEKKICKLEWENSQLKSLSKHQQERIADIEKGQLSLKLMSEGYVAVPALGRPINPGMLYDCRSESFVTALHGDLYTLMNETISEPYNTTKTQVLDTDSLSKRLTALEMDQPIRASFLSGMVKVGGAAEYLNHPLEKGLSPLTAEEYVTLHYKRTNRVNNLPLDQLDTAACSELIQRGSATHVVAAVEHGAQAFLVFKKSLIGDKSEAVRFVKEMIPLCASTDEAVKPTVRGSNAYSSVSSCTFYGDCVKTEEVKGQAKIAELCRSLPNLSGPDGDPDVPLTVWLCPLTKLNSAAPVVREVTVRMLSRVENALMQCRQGEERLKDVYLRGIVNNPSLTDFFASNDQLQQQKAEVSRVLKSVRSGEASEEELRVELDKMLEVVSPVGKLYPSHILKE